LSQAAHQLLAEGMGLRHNATDMDLLNPHFLWASCIWSAIASGYLIYGWRQRAATPLVAGAMMMTASFFLAALPMSLICIAAMAAVYWLIKQGY
jgi:hypothetical protein